MRAVKLRAVILTALLLGATVVGTVILTSGAAAAATNSTDSRFEVTDVSNTNGNLSVTLEGTSSEEVSEFRFTYQSPPGGTTDGPLAFTNTTAFVGAQYDNGTTVAPGSTLTLSESSGQNGQLTVVFDSRKNNFDFTTSAFRVNVTGYGADYSTADAENRSVIEANQYTVDAVNDTGSPLSGIPLVLAEANSNETGGFTFLQGTRNLHCLGTVTSGGCTDPDSGATTALVVNDSKRTVPAPVSVQAFALSESNASAATTLASGSNTLTVDQPAAPVFIMWQPLVNGAPTPNVDSISVVRNDTGTVVFRETNPSGATSAPPFLEPNTEYTVTLENSSSFGTVNRTVVTPTEGTTNIGFRIETGSVRTSAVTAQVVNESGDPVSGAVVTATPSQGGGNQIDAINTANTDENGVFSMTVPETDQLQGDMAFRIVGTDTEGGTPIYYPTTDDNDGEGYVVQSSKTVLPRMALRKGGRVDVSVTSPGSQLPAPAAFTSLSQASSAYPSLTRTANSNTFTRLGIGSPPPSASVALLSPTTSTDREVAYNIWSFDTKYVCADNIGVSQGTETATTCSLEQSGYINLSVEQYESIVAQSSSTYANVEDPGFFFGNRLIVRNATTGDLVTYIGPAGAQQFFLETDGTATDVEVPVPQGEYTVELQPRSEFPAWTSADDSTQVSVTAGATTDVSLDRGRPFAIQPAFDRTDRSLTQTGNNTVAFRVSDPATGALLDGSTVDASLGLQYPNGTQAMTPVDLTYNSSDGTFETTTFTPADNGVAAGAYDVALTVSYAEGSRTYESTATGPVSVSNFATYVEFSSRTVSPGGTLVGRIKGFSGSTGVEADATDVDIAVVDQNGNRVTTTTADSSITNGVGSFNISMPSDTGRYLVVATINSKNSGEGFARRGVRVSSLDLDISTDRRTYGPSDNVTLDIEATKSTDGSAVADATATVRVNGERATTTTDSTGEAVVELNPGRFADGKTWDRGHGVSVTLTRETQSGVSRQTAQTGFEVQAFDAYAEPTSRSFGPTESAEINVYVPEDASIDSVAVTELDGDAGVNYAGTEVAPGLWRVDVGQQDVGRHAATVRVRTTSGDSETARTGFAVESYELAASLSDRSVQTGEPIDLTVGVRDTDGNAVDSQQVDVSLVAAGTDTQVDSGSAQTNADGEVSFSLTSDQGGPHYIEVSVGQQTRTTGLLVSDVSVRLEDSAGNPVDGYEVSPGTTETLYVNATGSDGTDVSDGADVTAVVDTYGERVELGSATTTNGVASIDVDIPPTVPAREFGLGVRVTASSGTGVTTGVLNVTGSNAREIVSATDQQAYTAGDTATFGAEVTTGDGSPVTGTDVDFIVLTPGGSEDRTATVTTDSDGVATVEYTIPSDALDGRYALLTALNDSRTIRDYSGYRVRSLDVSVDAADGPFTPGETVSLTVNATDSTTGDTVTATDGSIQLSLRDTNIDKTLSLSGSAPYNVSVTLPDDSGVVGTRGISVTVSRDGASDTASTLIDVEDDTESANFTVEEPVVAGNATTVTVNGTVDTTATLTAFSPAAGTVAFNDSVTVSSSSETTTSMTIDSPGTHVVKLDVPGVGTLTEVVEVEPDGAEPQVWTGNDTATNSTSFTTTEDIYIKANQEGLTATVIGPDEEYTVELDQQDGDTYYGVLSAERPADVYLVRLDSPDATSLDDEIVEVTD